MNFSRLTAQKSCPKFMVITLGLAFQAARAGTVEFQGWKVEPEERGRSPLHNLTPFPLSQVWKPCKCSPAKEF